MQKKGMATKLIMLIFFMALIAVVVAIIINM